MLCEYHICFTKRDGPASAVVAFHWASLPYRCIHPGCNDISCRYVHDRCFPVLPLMVGRLRGVVNMQMEDFHHLALRPFCTLFRVLASGRDNRAMFPTATVVRDGTRESKSHDVRIVNRMSSLTRSYPVPAVEGYSGQSFITMMLFSC